MKGFGKRVSSHVFLITLIFLLFVQANAQEATGKFKFGITERLRNTYYNNIIDFNDKADDETDFIRVRTNVWGQYSFTPQVMVFAQLTNEFRPYPIDPKDRDFTFDEIFVDNLYLKWTVGKQMPTTFTLGRQNLIYGEGFILLDGAPWDGSRAIYHDAVKISMKKGNITIDLLGISNTGVEERLPLIKSSDLADGKLEGQTKDQWMNDNKEQAMGVYMTRTGAAGCRFEGYYIYKTEDPKPFINISAPKDQLKLSTLGGRYLRPVTKRMTITTEWAYQFGSQGDFDQKSWGGYGYVSYLACEKSKGTVSAGLFALSGDNPNTPNNEGWNPLFSRWPKWSELYIYSHLNETIQGARRVAYWTNTFAPYIKYTFNISPKINLSTTFYHLTALQERKFANGNMSGKTRGEEIQLLVNFAFTKSLSGHFLYDYCTPGDFYPDGSVGGPFIRTELMYKFTH